MITIYGLIDPLSKELRYIGKARDPAKRYKSHIKDSKYKRTHKEKWISSLLLAGAVPELITLSTCLETDWREREREEIAIWTSLGARLTNGTFGGDGCEATPAVRLKISERVRGFRHTQEAKDKMRRAKQKIPKRPIDLFRTWGGTPRVPVIAYCAKSGEMVSRFPSISAAARSLGISPGAICSVVNGRLKETSGFIFNKDEGV